MLRYRTFALLAVVLTCVGFPVIKLTQLCCERAQVVFLTDEVLGSVKGTNPSYSPFSADSACASQNLAPGQVASFQCTVLGNVCVYCDGTQSPSGNYDSKSTNATIQPSGGTVPCSTLEKYTSTCILSPLGFLACDLAGRVDTFATCAIGTYDTYTNQYIVFNRQDSDNHWNRYVR